MASYFLTFRVDEETRGYDAKERRDSIKLAITKMSPKTWDGPTSFFIFETASTNINTVLEKIVAGLDESLDVIFIRRVGYKSSRVWGAVSNEDWENILAMVDDAEFVTFNGV